MPYCRQMVSLLRPNPSFRTRVTAFLGHRAFHEDDAERDRKGQHGHHPKGVEKGERRRLLLVQVFELPPGELLRGDRIAGLLKEERLSPREEGIDGRVERIEGLAKSKDVKLITPLF